MNYVCKIGDEVPIIIGKTNTSGRIQINEVIDIDVKSAKHAWINGLRDKLL